MTELLLDADDELVVVTASSICAFRQAAYRREARHPDRSTRHPACVAPSGAS